jgi:dihydroflavonol-4-reductase
LRFELLLVCFNHWFDDNVVIIIESSVSMSKVLVTGASGYIASHVILQLLEQGFEVVGTIRDEGQKALIRSDLEEYSDHVDQLSFRMMELLDPLEYWMALVDDCDYMIHLASPFPRVSPKNDDEIVKPAKTSIMNALIASSQTSVKRVVFVSSIGAVAYGHKRFGEFDEDDWTDATNYADTSAYFRSKAIAEQAAFEYGRDEKNPVEFTSIAAGLVLGPLIYDTYGTSIGIIKSIMEGKYPTLPGVGYSVVDVRSVAALLIKAMLTPEAAGERYCATEEWISFPHMSEVLQEVFPDRQVKVGEMPNWMVKLISFFSPELRQILIDVESKRIVKSDKARKLLGWESISVKQTLADTAMSLIEKGIVE